MKLLDIDMDYFLDKVPRFIPDSSIERLDDNDYFPWKRADVISFLENNIGLSKNKKLRGKIIINHNEALYEWRKLIDANELEKPFEVVHIDSHADLGLGYASWVFIFTELLGIEFEKRSKIEDYEYMFKKYYKPGIGDYLLFAIAFRWISKLTYICNQKERGNDYIWMTMKNLKEPNDKIQLSYNRENSPLNIYSDKDKQRYLSTAIFEPEVEFEILREIKSIKYDGNFDFFTFCISPNYTPKSADFIIDIIRKYIIEE